ncbi:MAG TPA: undecaprenyldiphospho-muramoylpentapeptide beta-N-acetylglucosaminyltransferase [Sediminibacterium sp.]|nr:undecaprenyldiphospho-muramoylpentapeptide beta-N-acetylglucosaminyltransferase [Sediminibacterium sp.]
MSKRFIIAGGGTGGHIFPAIAIANAIKARMPDAVFLFVGAKGKMEMEKVPKAGYAIEGLDIAGFNRSSLLKNIGLPYKLFLSFLQVRHIFKKFKPDAVIGVGGYSSFPVLRFAQSRGIKTFIHESNSFAGKSNILLGKNATRVFVATPGMEKFFPAAKIMVSGNPIRSAIANSSISRNEALQFFGLDPAKQTILVVGGSLGATSINDALLNGLDVFEKNNLQLIWQTGKVNAARYARAAAGKNHIWVNEFIQEMEYGYAAADVIVSRAGAMAVTEISVVAKPAVLVPFPFAAEDHQTANAMQLVNAGAALIVKDAEAAASLVNTVTGLALDKARQESLRLQIRQFGRVDADQLIANEILKMIA